jgi:WD40 repeat protein
MDDHEDRPPTITKNVPQVSTPVFPGRRSAVERLLPEVEFVVRSGHSSRVAVLAFTPDGSTLATGSHDETVKLWNVGTGRLIHTFEHRDAVSALGFAPGGQVLGVGSGDWGGASVTFWDVGGGAPLLRMEQEGRPDSLAFDGAGRFCATCSDGLLAVRNTRSGSVLRSEKFERYRKCVMATETKANLLAVACRGRIEVQDFHTGRRRQRLRIGDVEVKHLSFSADGSKMVACDSEHNVRVWSTNGWVLEVEVKVQGSDTFAVHPNANRVATASSKDILQWDLVSGKVVARWEADEVSALTYSADGELLAEVFSSESARVWTTDGDLKMWVDGYANAADKLSINQRSSLVAVTSSAAAWVWDLRRGTLRYAIQPPKGSYVSQAEFFGPDSKLVVRTDSELAVYAGDTGLRIQSLRRVRQRTEQFATNHQGTLLAWSDADHQVSLWDGSGVSVRPLRCEDRSELEVAFDPSGEILAVGGYNDRTVSVWEARTGRRLWTVPGSFPVAFDRSRSLAVELDRDRIAVYSPKTGKLVRVMKVPADVYIENDLLTDIQFSPSGNHLAAACWFGRVHLWEHATGRHVGHLDRWTKDISFHPAEDALAASHSNNCVTLWNPALQQVGTLSGLGLRCAASLSFDRTGRTLVTGLHDGRVMVWSMARKQWVATFLPVSPNKWVTYTREGHFIGSPDIGDSVSMHFGRGERSYPSGALPRPHDNPNPEKVAAALAFLRQATTAAPTVNPTQASVAGDSPRLLGQVGPSREGCD